MLTAGKAIQIEKFAIDRSTLVRDCYLFFHKLLAQLTTALSKLEQSDYETLTALRSPTIRYRPATPMAPPAQFPSYILPIQKRDFISNRNTWFTNDRKRFEFDESMPSVNDDDWLVLKACAKLLSGSWSERDQMRNFLDMCSKLRNESSLKIFIKKLYLGVYTVNDRRGICFALTRYLPYKKCSTEEFAQWWRANRQIAATAFVEHVFKVAFEAIESGFYHWDIRPANLLFEQINENEIRFYTLDWDSLAKSMDGTRHSDAADTLEQEAATSPALDTLKAELSLCEKLLFECVFKWDHISHDSKKKAEGLFLFVVENFPCEVLNATLNQSDIREKYFLHLMNVLLRLVCLVLNILSVLCSTEH